MTKLILLTKKGKSQEVRYTGRSKCCRICLLLAPLVLCGFVIFYYISTVLCQRSNLKTFHPMPQSWQNRTKQEPAGQKAPLTESPPINPPVAKTPGPYEIIYPHKYQIILNEPEKCKGQDPFVVLMVPVRPEDQEARDIIRRTWGSESTVPGVVIRTLFLLGVTNSQETLQQKLIVEGQEHHDLLQFDFHDSYRNLTIKTMLMMEWLNTYCHNAPYAAKVDTDMFLNVDLLVNKLLNPQSAQAKRDYITGAVVRGGIARRDHDSKWYMPEEVFSKDTYPCYVSGNAYVFSMDLPEKILRASNHVKPVHLEDVYLGMCLESLGISPKDPPSPGMFQMWYRSYDRCLFSGFISVTGIQLKDLERNWANFRQPGSYC
ncbi:beta-1,3-galactosyltransferase 1-like [Paramormyrops kingsleyae]|uniref:Hexosyltransferase n=1 Tax=Paramormyrops kingsleyae TaxID=1676925 RepID=A0A3B3QCI0_9TELE|nr:beta-1,3-galactosyltransferase 1-like [Paramormyrops kingsleyae]XP_023698887.1 beta-1,3-galactosyltransferase 1-like [Paramormyrops kingsleyae]XP_023698888.1 beta-1,3-galactosyltransferase 1-like [Paramormyrops kingsleyae]XP_023698889.1 beta-1,3-galactosyltransferase 1-like [Paramormyrops kingsleyae]XP_023698890.1 beta-1,3-galactosyltransferase 1-like [Paramormyrops kingsleyae]XP_023698891.1 beta-1,3-galactosyltransferase 1-like [Paramormyrops kingsleyae]XP_023698893.1 beta-1,3-galactosylt